MVLTETDYIEHILAEIQTTDLIFLFKKITAIAYEALRYVTINNMNIARKRVFTKTYSQTFTIFPVSTGVINQQLRWKWY